MWIVNTDDKIFEKMSFYNEYMFCYSKMDENPWNVDCIQDFSFLNCPECTFKGHLFSDDSGSPKKT